MFFTLPAHMFMSCVCVFFCCDAKNSSVMLVSFNIGVVQNFLDNYCWWFRKPANNLRLVVEIPIIYKGFSTIPGWWLAAHSDSQLVPSCFGALRPARHVMRTCNNAGHGGENKKRVEDVQPLMTSKLFHQFSHEKCISNISMFVLVASCFKFFCLTQKQLVSNIRYFNIELIAILQGCWQMLTIYSCLMFISRTRNHSLY